MGRISHLNIIMLIFNQLLCAVSGRCVCAGVALVCSKFVLSDGILAENCLF